MNSWPRILRFASYPMQVQVPITLRVRDGGLVFGSRLCMDKLNLQCQALAQQINKEKQWELSSRQISNLVRSILPLLQHLSKTSRALNTKDKSRIQSLIEASRLCHELASKVNSEREWQLTPDQITALTAEVMPHVVPGLKSKQQLGSVESRIRSIIMNYYAEGRMAKQLLALSHKKSTLPPKEWQDYLESVAAKEYKLTNTPATAFVNQVWPYLLRSLKNYHFESPLTVWMYHIMSHFYEDVKEYGKDVKDWLNPGEPRLYNMVDEMAHRLSWDDADDLAQDARVDILRGLEGFYFGCRLRTWVEEIVRNCRTRRWKGERTIKRGRDIQFVPLDERDEQEKQSVFELPSPGPGPDEEAEYREVYETLERAIREVYQRMNDKDIPRWKKEWIAGMRLAEGEDYETISRQSGENKNTTMTIVARAKPHLLNVPSLKDYLPALETTVHRLGRNREELPPDEPARPGEELRFRIAVTNVGEKDARKVMVLALLSQELKHSAESAPSCQSWVVLREESLPERIEPSRAHVSSPVWDEALGAVKWEGVVKPWQRIDIVFMAQLSSPLPLDSTILCRVEIRISGILCWKKKIPIPLAK